MKLAHTKTLCGKGIQATEFRSRLAGVAVDSSSRLYALGDQEVKVFSADGKLLRRFPTRENGWSICVAGDRVWVGMRGVVAQFDTQGRQVDRLEDATRLGRVTALAAAGQKLLVADATHRAIYLYENGRWAQDIGADVNTRGFMLPNGVLDLALEANGETFVVAHPQKHRVERYDWSGELKAKFGRFGAERPEDFGGCCNPTNIASAPDGLIAVSEKAPPRVKIYSTDGQFLAQSTSDRFDPNTKNLDLAFDGAQRLYATDPLRCTIELFELTDDGD